jgi:hypothetical protein
MEQEKNGTRKLENDQEEVEHEQGEQGNGESGIQ